MNMQSFEVLESRVRSYSRSWPTVFARSKGSRLWDEQGREYLDFFSGAGSLNYGHNDPDLQRALIEHVLADGVTHSLDMSTTAKREFLEALHDVLQARGLDYRVQFTGPTGANSVEAALKLARKVTGRSLVVSFHGAFHGMSLGALSVNGSARRRASAGVPLRDTVQVDYERPPGTSSAAARADLREQLSIAVARVRPAAVIVESIQAEGGVHPASREWLRELRLWCDENDCLLILDEIQTGCGRTGEFFGFESAGITPDLVCVAKSISGLGLPLALLLIRPEFDRWEPGEHNGTFRGNNHAFVTGTGALRKFWMDREFEQQTQQRSRFLLHALTEVAEGLPGARVRGRGLMAGLDTGAGPLAAALARAAFTRGLLLETCGPEGEVVKLLPPLVASEEDLRCGLEILALSLEEAVGTAAA